MSRIRFYRRRFAIYLRNYCKMLMFCYTPLMKEKESIILLGIKHSGKTTHGKLLAGHYALPFIDTDFVVEKMTGKSPRVLYSEKGSSSFMIAEENACRKTAELLEGKAAVIATGGGICGNPPALMFLRPLGKFVYLYIPENIAADRIFAKASKTHSGKWENLPAYIAEKEPETEEDCREIFHRFYIERSNIYSGIADCTVELGNNFSSSKDGNLQKIISALEQ